MRRGAAAGWGLTIALLGACGHETTAPPVTSVAARRGPARPEARAHVEPAPAAPDPAAPVCVAYDALVAAYALTDSDARKAAVAQAENDLLATGPDGLTPLLPLLRDPWGAPFIAYSLVLRFGKDAVLPLCGELESGRHPAPDQVYEALGELSEFWKDGPLAERVGRALVTVVADYQGGGENLSDEEIGDDGERGEHAVAVLKLLADAPAAARGVTAEIATAWLRWTRYDANEDARETALRILRNAGTAGAAAALPVVLAAADELPAVELAHVLWIAQEAATACSGALPVIERCLGHEDAAVRRSAVVALRSFGSAAPGARERLAALLDDPDADVRAVTAAALGALPDGAELAWRRLLEDAHSGQVIEPRFTEDFVRAALAEGRLGKEMLGGLDGLSEAALGSAVRLLRDERPDLVPDLVHRLATAPDALRRSAALSACTADGAHPEEAAALLRDPDPGVRVRAAAAVLSWVDTPLRDEARAVLAAALDDPDDANYDRAVVALSRDDAAVVGASDRAVRRLTGGMLDDRWMGAARAAVLVRCEGGIDAFEAALRPLLRPGFGTEGRDRAVVTAIGRAGPAAAGLRDALVAVRDAGAGHRQRDVEQLLAALDGDTLTYAATTEDAADLAVARLLAMGADGPKGIVLLAGRTVWSTSTGSTRYDDEAVLAAIARARGPVVDTAVLAASGALDGPYGGRLLRLGAAVLADGLPPERALPLLASLVRDSDGHVRHRAAEALAAVEARAPGSVPLDLVRQSLRDPGRQGEGLVLARGLGSRAEALLEPLRTIRSQTGSYRALEAAALVGRLTGDADEAARFVRAALAGPLTQGDETSWWNVPDAAWDAVIDVFLAAPPRPEDVAFLLGVRGSVPTSALLPILERHGADAAPAIPWLRELLEDEPVFCGNGAPSFGQQDPRARDVARVLLAIGRPACVALPDLRRRMAWRGDASGELRDVIGRLEAMQ